MSWDDEPEPVKEPVGHGLPSRFGQPHEGMDLATGEVFEDAEEGGTWDEEVEPVPEPVYTSLPDFVENFVLRTWRRSSAQSLWCPVWWEHHEAILRLEVLWDAFEATRVEPGAAMSAWVRDHWDVHMRVLTERETSPFWACKEGHTVPPPMPATEPIPEGLFLPAQ